MARALRLAAAFLLVAASVRAQSSDATVLWPTVNGWLQLPSHLRILATGQLQDATNADYQEWTGGIGIGYQWKQILKQHLVNINQDKESKVTGGVGYEYVATDVPGNDKREDRLVLTVTPRARPAARWLVEDRNRFEFRWVNGKYSTRYRNRLTVEHDLKFSDFRMTPFAAVELYYSFSSGTLDEEQYSIGLQFPFHPVAMVEVYYLRQQCTSCEPGDANMIGLTANWYFGTRRPPDR